MKKNNLLIKIVIGGILLFIIGGFIRENYANNKNQKGTEQKTNSSLEQLVGKQAPAFSLTDTNGKVFTSENLKGKKVVLFFNEGLACYPACWEQMKQLSADERFAREDVVVFSVVTDAKGSWKSAIEKKPDLGDIDVLFDEGAVVSKAFGALNVKSSMHAGTPGHTYIIIDKEGVVRYVLDDPRMGINNGEISAQVGKLQ